MRLVSKAEGEKRILYFLDYLRTLQLESQNYGEKKRVNSKYVEKIGKKEILL